MLSAIKSQEILFTKRRLKRAKLAGAWLTVVLDIINGLTLSEYKSQDNLSLYFGLEPLELWDTYRQAHCCAS